MRTEKDSRIPVPNSFFSKNSNKVFHQCQTPECLWSTNSMISYSFVVSSQTGVSVLQKSIWLRSACDTLKVGCPWADWCRGEQAKTMCLCDWCWLACSTHFFSAVVHLSEAGDADLWKRSVSLKYSPSPLTSPVLFWQKKILQPAVFLKVSTSRQAMICAVVRQCILTC